MNVEIVVDTREQQLLPIFNEFKLPPNITYRVEQVNIGDYSILYNGNIFITIERKTWKDLAQSMLDGRKENVNKLIKLREEVGCHLFYLIEGTPIPKSDAKYCRMRYKALRSHLDHLMFRDNIHIIHSKDLYNTVERIIELVQNYLTIKPSPLSKYDLIDGGGVQKLKEKTQVDPSSIIYKIWTCLPNITEKTASLFVNKNYHISDLILGNITKEQIYSMTYDNGYVIGKRADKIWNGSRIKESNNKYFVKMLTNINGVTKKTAEILMQELPFEKLIKGELTCEEINNIQKSPTKKVGSKAAGLILQYFSKQIN